MTNKKKYSSLELYRRVFLEIRPYRLHIGAILLVTLLSPPLSLLIPLPLKIAVDSVIGSHPIPAFLQPVIPQAIIGSPGNMLTFVIVLMMVVALLGGLQRVASTLLRTYTGEKLTLAFRNKLFRHVSVFRFHITIREEQLIPHTGSSMMPLRFSGWLSMVSYLLSLQD